MTSPINQMIVRGFFAASGSPLTIHEERDPEGQPFLETDNFIDLSGDDWIVQFTPLKLGLYYARVGDADGNGFVANWDVVPWSVYDPAGALSGVRPVLVSSVLATGEIRLRKGDDYPHAGPDGLIFIEPKTNAWPDLTGAEITLGAYARGRENIGFVASGGVLIANGEALKKVYIEIAGTVTADLPVVSSPLSKPPFALVFDFQVKAEIDGVRKTLAEDILTLFEDYEQLATEAEETP